MKAISVDAVGAKRGERPVEDAPAADLGEALGGVGGGRHQALAAAGADDDGPHQNLLDASTRALSCRRAIERLASASAQHETSVSMIASWATRLLIASGR